MTDPKVLEILKNKMILQYQVFSPDGSVVDISIKRKATKTTFLVLELLDVDDSDEAKPII